MSIVNFGSVNMAAQGAPGLTVQIVPPSNVSIAIAPTSVLGMVGVASWGPVNQPVAVGNLTNYNSIFGSVQVRKYDMATHIDVAQKQGANNFRCVRVTDGTDVAATVTIPSGEIAGKSVFYTNLANAINLGLGVNVGASNTVTFNATSGVINALYSGSVGNTVVLTVSQGSKANTARVVVNRPNIRGELFDNIPFATGEVPVFTSYSLSGGTDGASGVTDATLIGTIVPRTGMYALENQGSTVIDLVDCQTASLWTTCAQWGYGQGVLFSMAGPSGESLASASTNLESAGLDDYDIEVFLGDYLYYYDATNQVVRLVSPVAFHAGKRVSLTPNDSTLNKELYGILGSQKSGLVGSGTLTAYTSAEVLAIELARLNVIGNPSPGGSYWSCLIGHTTSSDSGIWTENYTIMTFMIAKSINGSLGKYVGLPITKSLMQSAKSALLSMFSMLETYGYIGTTDGSPAYAVVLDTSNNSVAQTGSNVLQANTSCNYQGIVEQFFVNTQGGSTVTIGSNGANS